MANNPNHIKNLRHFKKGEVANPTGRPKKLPDLQVLLADVLGKESKGKTAAEAILDALKEKAAKGDVRAAEILLDRAWGKAKQSVEHSGEVGITWHEEKTYATEPKAD
jgi:hypothetical protein